MSRTSQCQNCGTVFQHGDEPWLKQREHCTRHDVVFVAGSECTNCVAEREDAANRPAVDESEADNVEVHSGDSDTATSGQQKGRRRH
jgi:predicted  nucleic acid-binding Zn-ribbon protein